MQQSFVRQVAKVNERTTLVLQLRSYGNAVVGHPCEYEERSESAKSQVCKYKNTVQHPPSAATFFIPSFLPSFHSFIRSFVRSFIYSFVHFQNTMASSITLFTIILSSLVTSTVSLSWSSCGTGLDCASLTVPLEYANSSTSSATASIALARYNATVDSAQRLGSLLVNPGGPGASGVSFVLAGAGAAISTLTGGMYDIIGWDPRGVGSTTPLLECFASAGAEYNFSSTFPGGPNLWSGEFSNSSYDSAVQSAISDFDSAVAQLAKDCVSQDSPALFTSSAAYVARDMAAIVDELDGTSAKLNYWGFSYGTIYLAEFIQAFPERVGRLVADGVVNPTTNAEEYSGQLPIDQTSVRPALNDLIAFCESAGSEDCPLSVSPSGTTSSLNLTDRINNLFEDLFQNPITIDGLQISLAIFNPFLWSFMRVPVTWAKVSQIIQGLEARNATLLIDLLNDQASPAPTNADAPGVGTQSEYPLQCIDNRSEEHTSELQSL